MMYDVFDGIDGGVWFVCGIEEIVDIGIGGDVYVL